MLGGLKHLKIETRLIDEKFANVMGDLHVIGDPSKLSLYVKLNPTRMSLGLL